MTEVPNQVRVLLTRAERLALLDGFNVSDEIRKRLQPSAPHEVEVWMTIDEADDLRDQVADRLQTHGFDADYKHNELGNLLEDLIDKLYPG